MSQFSRIRRYLTMPCEEVVSLVSRSMDDTLPRGERWAIRLHMLYCTACRRFRKQVTLLRDALRHRAQHIQQLPSESLSDAARARFKQAMSGPDS